VRILVVEDSAKMASLVRRGLEEDGFAVDVASDADEAIWCARESSYDAVRVDAGRLRQAMDDLLDNAVRHTPSGGRIDVTGVVMGGEITRAVQDSGPGFSPRAGKRSRGS